MDPFLLKLKYTKILFKFVNFQMFIILSKRLAWFCVSVYITYSFKARCSIEFKGAVNKKYSAVRQISRTQYIYFYLSDFKVEQNLVGSTQNVSARSRERQPKDLETYRLELARSLHTEPTHSRAKETAETA